MTGLAATLERTRETTIELRRQRKAIKLAKPRVFIYKNNPDGSSAGLMYEGRLHINELTDYEFPRQDNISSAGHFQVRASHHLAKFIQTVPNNPEECKNIVIRVDMYGGKFRWSGLMHHWTVETTDGVDLLTANWNDDLQFLQFMLGPPNPLLPIPLFQFPRDFLIFAPSRWAVSVFIWLQIVRLEGHPFTLPDDPFDFSQYFDIFNPKDWQVHIKCPSFLEDSSLWTVIGSRMNTVDSVIADALEDGQLSIIYRRYFTDEGEQVSGLFDNDIANGALVFEIEDRSGFVLGSGTFFGGTAVGGLARSLLQWTDGFVQDTLVLFQDNETLYPDEYFQSSWLASLAQAPAHCLRDSHWNDLQSKVTHSPATAVSVIVGGDNPVADAIAQLIIQSVGNLIGYFLLGGFDSLGDIASDIIMPFLVGTILAWLEWKNFTRATSLGWVHLHEIYQQGAENNVWSLAGLAAWRGGFKATDSETNHTMVVGSHTWFIPGLHGDIGDRLASTSGALRRNAGINLLFVNQMKQMNLRKAGGNEGTHEFLMALGENKAAMSTGERTARTLKFALDKIHDIGVRIVS
jgi:hypothetical protein